MTKGRVSIVIPSRGGQPYLQETINDLFSKAEGDIEIIVACDGLWPDPALKKNPKVLTLHHGTVFENLGMREGINRGIAISTGEFIMKIDEHCMVDQGFDTKLKADMEENMVMIPRRYRLLADETPWRLEEYLIQPDGSVIEDPEYKVHRPPIDYMYLAYPYERPYDKTCGLHGAEDRQRSQDRRDIFIDDTMSWQGSCWFTTKKHWDNVIKELDSELYGTFTQEAQEIGLKTQMAGGRLVVNKKTWYAHMHKGMRGKRYGFSNEQYRKHMEGTERGRINCIKYWVFDNREFFKKLLAQFWPVSTWPEDWEERIEKDKLTDFSTLRQQQGAI